MMQIKHRQSIIRECAGVCVCICVCVVWGGANNNNNNNNNDNNNDNNSFLKKFHYMNILQRK
jgi:hypothetical protein